MAGPRSRNPLLYPAELQAHDKYSMRWCEITENSVDHQEQNLQNNWEFRKAKARQISSQNGNEVYLWKGDGRVVAYVVRDEQPLGYVACFEDPKKTLQINSTYFTPKVRKQGLGTLAYKSMMDAGFTLISDYDRSDGANALWAKLARDPSLDIQDNGFDRFIGTKK